MSTTRFPLLITQAAGCPALPLSNPAAVASVTSSAAATTNTPKPTYYQLQFDQTTDKFAVWTFRIPDDYVSSPVMTIKLAAAVNTGNVIMGAGLAVGLDNTTDVSAGTFLACDVSATTAVPATIGLEADLSWSLTSTGLVVGALVSVFLSRRASAAGDTAAGTSYANAVQFSYTS